MHTQRSSITGSKQNRTALISNGGIFLLLDTLDFSRPRVQSMVVGCLLDMSDDHEACEHMYAWKSAGDLRLDTQRRFIHMYRSHARILGLDVSGLDLWQGKQHAHVIYT